MNTNVAEARGIKAHSFYDHHDDYIPVTTPWDERNICEYVPLQRRDMQTCCSSTKVIDRAVDKAYRNGLQEHHGIQAIQDYPCVTDREMTKISNDLSSKIEQHGIQMELPNGLDPDKQPFSATKEIRDYCKEVIFEKLARELGRISESKPIAFTKQVVRYCQYALTLSPSALDPSVYINEGWRK